MIILFFQLVYDGSKTKIVAMRVCYPPFRFLNCAKNQRINCVFPQQVKLSAHNFLTRIAKVNLLAWTPWHFVPLNVYLVTDNESDTQQNHITVDLPRSNRYKSGSI